MRIIGNEEIQALIRMTPDTPANGPLLDSLDRLAQETSIVRFPYSYNAVFAAIAPAGTATVNIAIDAAAPFLIVNQTYEANVTAGAAQTSGTFCYPNMTILLTDTSSNRQMMDVGVPVVNLFGNGQFPYVLPEPKLMAANSVLQVTATSFEAANSPVLRLTFNGYKLYSLNR